MAIPLTVALVCAYGILKEFRPATPFLSAFLRSAPKNFTNEELYSQVYPFWTYSYLVFLIPVFFITDYLRYKPVVVLEAAALSGTWLLLVFGETVWQMQIMQILFVVDKKNFKKVTAYIRSSVLLGKFFAYGVAQLLITTKWGSYMLLNQITLGALLITFVISLVLQFYNAVEHQRVQPARTHTSSLEADLHDRRLQHSVPSMRGNVLRELWDSFKDPVVLVWSIWWALASCGTFQVMNYAQSLWAPLQEQGQFMGNGFMEIVATFVSTILTFALQYSEFSWKRHGSKIFFVASLAESGLLLGMAAIPIIWTSYFFYICNSAIYHVLIAAASNTIAAQLHSSKFSLIFGFNTFLALVLQSVLTFAVADKSGLNLPIVTQFYVYSGYFLCLAVIFVPTAFLHYHYCLKKGEEDASSNSDEDNTGSQDSTVTLKL